MAAAGRQLHVFGMDVGKTARGQLHFVQVSDLADDLKHDAGVEPAHLRTAQPVGTGPVLEIGVLFRFNEEQAVFVPRLGFRPGAEVRRRRIKDVYLLRFAPFFVDEGDFYAVVSFGELELPAEGACLVDLDLLAVHGGLVAGVGDADQIVAAVSNRVAVIARSAAETYLRRSFREGGQQQAGSQ